MIFYIAMWLCLIVAIASGVSGAIAKEESNAKVGTALGVLFLLAAVALWVAAEAVS